MASYSRTMNHPPIFGALTRKVNPYGAVAILARKLAVTEPNDQAKLDKLNNMIDLALEKHRPWHINEDMPPEVGISWDEGLVLHEGDTEWHPWNAPSPEDLWGSPEGANE